VLEFKKGTRGLLEEKGVKSLKDLADNPGVVSNLKLATVNLVVACSWSLTTCTSENAKKKDFNEQMLLEFDVTGKLETEKKKWEAIEEKSGQKLGQKVQKTKVVEKWLKAWAIVGDGKIV